MCPADTHGRKSSAQTLSIPKGPKGVFFSKFDFTARVENQHLRRDVVEKRKCKHVRKGVAAHHGRSAGDGYSYVPCRPSACAQDVRSS
jgi:hypothetical protein